jgi:ADP-heptose:LPS heptosyltransferase
MQIKLSGVRQVHSRGIRQGLAYLAQARLYIGPEGGLHHAAAALNIPGVVLFGGFIPPQITGYIIHANLTGGDTEACGILGRCLHCKQAMQRITVDEVLAHAYIKIREFGCEAGGWDLVAG